MPRAPIVIEELPASEAESDDAGSWEVVSSSGKEAVLDSNVNEPRAAAEATRFIPTAAAAAKFMASENAINSPTDAAVISGGLRASAASAGEEPYLLRDAVDACAAPSPQLTSGSAPAVPPATLEAPLKEEALRAVLGPGSSSSMDTPWRPAPVKVLHQRGGSDWSDIWPTGKDSAGNDVEDEAPLDPAALHDALEHVDQRDVDDTEDDDEFHSAAGGSDTEQREQDEQQLSSARTHTSQLTAIPASSTNFQPIPECEAASVAWVCGTAAGAVQESTLLQGASDSVAGTGVRLQAAAVPAPSASVDSETVPRGHQLTDQQTSAASTAVVDEEWSHVASPSEAADTSVCAGSTEHTVSAQASSAAPALSEDMPCNLPTPTQRGASSWTQPPVQAGAEAGVSGECSSPGQASLQAGHARGEARMSDLETLAGLQPQLAPHEAGDVAQVTGEQHEAGDVAQVTGEQQQHEGQEGEEGQQEQLSEEAMQARIEEAEALKKQGNDAFGLGEYELAEELYTRALDAAPAAAPQRAVYAANRAAASLQRGDAPSAVRDCTAALAIDPDYIKALMRRCKAYEMLGDQERALGDAQRVLQLQPDNGPARAVDARLGPVVEEQREKLKEEMMGKLKDLGNSILGHFGMSLDNFKAVQDPNSGGYSISFQQ